MPQLWISHSVLLRECLITGYIVAKSPLRVGVGREAPLGSPVDLAVLRVRFADGRSSPVIPGSSLKGVFRSTAIQLARAKNLRVCSGLSCGTCMDSEYSAGESLLERIESLLRKGLVSEALEEFDKSACLLCKIFGAPSFAGHVVVSDAYPIDENGNVLETLTGIRAGIAINRRTGATYPGALYHVEYVEPGSRFRFSIYSTNLPNYALGLLAKILRLMNQGWVRIGGFKSRGFGEVGVERLSFSARGPFIRESKLEALDERDEEVDLKDLAESSNGWLVCREGKAWDCLAKLEEVWDRAKLG
jgi:CRISPR-associated RAMP protein (TIGR02581 family)